MKNAPDRLTAITRYQSSSLIFSTVLSIVMPALLTRMSSRPCCSMHLVDACAGSPPPSRRSPDARCSVRPCPPSVVDELHRRARGHGCIPPRRSRPARRGCARSRRRSRGCRRSRTRRAHADGGAGRADSGRCCAVVAISCYSSLSDPSARPSSQASSGQISCLAFDPAIRPMWPPGRSRCVTSSLTRPGPAAAPCPRAGRCGPRPAVTTSRFCSIRSRSTRWPRSHRRPDTSRFSLYIQVIHSR